MSCGQVASNHELAGLLQIVKVRDLMRPLGNSGGTVIRIRTRSCSGTWLLGLIVVANRCVEITLFTVGSCLGSASRAIGTQSTAWRSPCHGSASYLRLADQTVSLATGISALSLWDYRVIVVVIQGHASYETIIIGSSRHLLPTVFAD